MFLARVQLLFSCFVWSLALNLNWAKFYIYLLAKENFWPIIVIKKRNQVVFDDGEWHERATHMWFFSSKMVIWPIFVFWLGYFWMILLLVVSSVNSFFSVCVDGIAPNFLLKQFMPSGLSRVLSKTSQNLNYSKWEVLIDDQWWWWSSSWPFLEPNSNTNKECNDFSNHLSHTHRDEECKRKLAWSRKKTHFECIECNEKKSAIFCLWWNFSAHLMIIHLPFVVINEKCDNFPFGFFTLSKIFISQIGNDKIH